VEILLLFWLMMGALASWIASQKGRSGVEGFVLGVLFGPLGVIVEAVLPSPISLPPAPRVHSQAAAGAAPPLSDDEIERMRRREIERAKLLARQMELLRENEEQAFAYRREVYRRLARSCRYLLLLAWSSVRYFLLFGWFRDIPDWLQAIALGLVFAIPGIILLILLFRGT